MAPAKKVVVRPTDDQRDAPDRLIRTGSHPAAMRRRAAVLLHTDAGGPDGWTDDETADHPGTTRVTAPRVRRQFAAGGLDATLRRKKPAGRPYREPDGEREARPVAVGCPKAPDGHARWTTTLPADKPVGPEVVEAIDPATVRRARRRATSSRGSSGRGSSRPRRRGRSSRRRRT